MPDQNNPLNPVASTPTIPTIGAGSPPPPPPPPVAPTVTVDKPKEKEKDDKKPKGGPDLPPVVTTGGRPKGKRGGKIIATILGVLLLVGAIGAGVILVGQQQDIREKAFGTCSLDSVAGCQFSAEVGSLCIIPTTPGSTCQPSGSTDAVGNPICICSPPEEGGGGPPPPPPPGGNACTSAGGTCRSTPSCSRENRVTVNGGNGCNAAAGEICCSKLTLPPECDSTSCIVDGACNPDPKCAICCNNTVNDSTCSSGRRCQADSPPPGGGGGGGGGGEVGCRLTDEGTNSSGQYTYKCGGSCSGGKVCKKAGTKNLGGGVLQGICKCLSTGDGGGQTAQCLNIQAFDSEFNLLTSSDLSALTPGDSIIFTVAGTATSGTFTGARFTINGTVRPVVTQKRPGTEEFMDTYTIPEGVTSFSIQAQIRHSSLGFF